MTGTKSYASKNAAAVLEQVKAHLQELDEKNSKGWVQGEYNRYTHRGYDTHKGWAFRMDSVYEALSIFDWWNETLSTFQLKQMQKFIEQAIKLGFTGYVCFKVGAAGCANGMWAYTEETTDGYSPEEGDTLYHSFVSGENYWDVEINGEWLHEKMLHPHQNYRFTLAQVKEALTAAKREKVLQEQPTQQPEEAIDESKEIAESAM